MGENYRIILAHRERYLARKDNEELYCVLSGSMRYQDMYPVVGDEVELTVNPYGDSLIRTILPRRTVFCRPNRNGHADGYVKTLQSQPLIANMDYVFIMTSLNQDFSLNRIARYAATAIAGGAIPVAVLTKADTCPDVAEKEAETRTISDQLQVVPVSSYTGYGLEKLKAYFKPGVTIALVGSSGAGKSTLINTLAGREVMRVSAIREEDAKGRHTTTHREIIEVDGVSLIDTPGLRELGMMDAEEGLADTFRDITDWISRCSFSDCRHGNEPGCAVRAALESGELAAERWEMFCRLQNENNWSKTRKNELMVNVALKRRQLNKNRK